MKRVSPIQTYELSNEELKDNNTMHRIGYGISDQRVVLIMFHKHGRIKSSLLILIVDSIVD